VVGSCRKHQRPVGLAVKHHDGRIMPETPSAGRSRRKPLMKMSDFTSTYRKMAKYMASTFFFRLSDKMGNKQPMCRTHTHATLCLLIPLSFSFLTNFLACPTVLCNHFFFLKKDKEEKIHDKATSLLQTNENIPGDSASTLDVVGGTGLAGGRWRRSKTIWIVDGWKA
jgi:hypothetical protein